MYTDSDDASIKATTAIGGTAGALLVLIVLVGLGFAAAAGAGAAPHERVLDPPARRAAASAPYRDATAPGSRGATARLIPLGGFRPGGG